MTTSSVGKTGRVIAAEAWQGGWTWFGGQSAYSSSSGHVLGYVRRSRGGTGAAICLSLIEPGRGIFELVLDDGYPLDDHDAPGVVWIADDELLFAYAGHHQSWVVHVGRVRVDGGRLDVLDRAQLSLPAWVTYAHLLRVGPDASQVLLVTRSIDFNPTAIWLDTESLGPSKPFVLFPWAVNEHDPNFSGRDGGRPYVIFRQQADRVIFALTNDHPRAYRNGIYAGVIKDTSICRANGEAVRDLRSPEPWDPFGSLSVVIPPGSLDVPWIQDVSSDPSGRMVVAWSSTPKDEAVFKAPDQAIGGIRYMLAEARGDSWTNEFVGLAGSSLYQGESDYVGGLSINPFDPDHLVISSNVDAASGEAPQDGLPRLFEVRRTADGPRYRVIAPDEGGPQLRPRFTYPHGTGHAHALFYMRGGYRSWGDFDTTISMIPFTPEESCFDRPDRHLDLPYPLRVGAAMPPLETSALVAYLRRSRRYLEYGAGASTLLAFQSGCEVVASVDFDRSLLEALVLLSRDGSAGGEFKPLLVDAKIIGPWAYPLGPEVTRELAASYASRGLDATEPDLVLIDGRYRVACFLQLLTQLRRETIVLWDDYLDRPQYQVVEPYAQPAKFFGRMAVFYLRAPAVIDPNLFSAARETPA